MVWAEKNAPLLAGSIALSGAVFLHGVLLMGTARALGFFALAFGAGWLAEASGMAFGFPFGAQYAYHPDLQPRLPGQVPLFIPLAWYVVTAGALVLLRDLSVRVAGRLHTGRLAIKALLAALAMVGVDLILDPLAVSVGAWTWEGDGHYLGTPLLNYVGWFGVGALVIALHLPWSEPYRDGLARRLDPLFAGLGVLLVLLAAAAFHLRTNSLVPLFVALPALAPGWLLYVRALPRTVGQPASSTAE